MAEQPRRYVVTASQRLGFRSWQGTVLGPAPDPTRLTARPQLWRCFHQHRTSSTARACAQHKAIRKGWA